MSNKTPLQRPNTIGQRLAFANGACVALCQDMLSEHDLTLANWVILSALWRRDGMSVSELADYTGNKFSATSRIIDRMDDRGLVTRRQAAQDRRGVEVFLTEAGDALQHLRDFYKQVNAILLKGMTDEEAATLFDLLERVEKNARAARET